MTSTNLKTHFSEKYLLLGHTGYIGQAFNDELSARGTDFASLGRSTVDYSCFNNLCEFLRDYKPTFVINCAGFTGKPNVDACEGRRAETILGNVVLPQTIADACEASRVPWGHVSSGCIYSGAKVVDDTGNQRVEKDLMRTEVREIWQDHPQRLVGFSENDAPNFSFRDPPCSFYSGSKALGEEVLAGRPDCFIWRLRIPFDEIDNPRNYLTKVQRYEKVYDNVNSLSHRKDFVKACIESWSKRVPFGTYNVTNKGWVTTRQAISIFCRARNLHRDFKYFLHDAEFYSVAATPRSNTILETMKLGSAGIAIRDIQDALEEAAMLWTGNTR